MKLLQKVGCVQVRHGARFSFAVPPIRCHKALQFDAIVCATLLVDLLGTEPSPVADDRTIQGLECQAELLQCPFSGAFAVVWSEQGDRQHKRECKQRCQHWLSNGRINPERLYRRPLRL